MGWLSLTYHSGTLGHHCKFSLPEIRHGFLEENTQENYEDFTITCVDFSKKTGEFQPAKGVRSPLHGDFDGILPLRFNWVQLGFMIYLRVWPTEMGLGLKNGGVDHQTYADFTWTCSTIEQSKSGFQTSAWGGRSEQFASWGSKCKWTQIDVIDGQLRIYQLESLVKQFIVHVIRNVCNLESG